MFIEAESWLGGTMLLGLTLTTGGGRWEEGEGSHLLISNVDVVFGRSQRENEGNCMSNNQKFQFNYKIAPFEKVIKII